MSAQDPLGSTVPPERPVNPTHFGGDGLYEADAQDAGAGSSQMSSQRSQSALWDFARRNHVPTVLAVGGFVWLLASLVRRSTGR
jgi:hypothetical protein